jgi:integrase
MASVHRRPDSAYWHAAFRAPDGRLVLRSTKQTDRAKALAVALEFQRAAKMARRGDLVEAQARLVLNDIMARADIGESIQADSIEVYFNRWISGKEARKSAGTGERYRCVVERFLESLGPRSKKPLTALVSRDIESFLNARLELGMASRTVILDVKVIRTALNAARRQGLVTVNAAEAVELPDVEGVERGTFTPAEIKILVDTAEEEWKTLILLAYYTGGRLSDCCRMGWDGVDLAKGSLTYTQTKTGHKLTLPLHPDLLAHLEVLAGTDKPSPFIMSHMAGLKPGGRHGLSEGFKRIMRKAGIDMQTVEKKGVRTLSRRTFHALRHSFTSALANANVSPELRMRLTGHKSAAVHSGYTHHELENLRAAVGKLPSLS